MRYFKFLLLLLILIIICPNVYAQNWVGTHNTNGVPIMIDMDSITPLGENFFYFIKYKDVKEGDLVVSIHYQRDTRLAGIVDSYTIDEFNRNSSLILEYLGSQESKSLKKVDMDSPIYNSVVIALGIKDKNISKNYLEGNVVYKTSRRILKLKPTKAPKFKSYMRYLQDDIKANWTPPKGQQNRRVIVISQIAKNGSLISWTIEQSSGIQDVDKAAIRAIQQTAPFAPLPRKFKDADIDILFTFHDNVVEATRY